MNKGKKKERRKATKNKPSMVWYKNWGMQDVAHQAVQLETIWKASMATVHCRKLKFNVEHKYHNQVSSLIAHLVFRLHSFKPWFGQKLISCSFCPNYDLGAANKNPNIYVLSQWGRHNIKNDWEHNWDKQLVPIMSKNKHCPKHCALCRPIEGPEEPAIEMNCCS